MDLLKTYYENKIKEIRSICRIRHVVYMLLGILMLVLCACVSCNIKSDITVTEDIGTALLIIIAGIIASVLCAYSFICFEIRNRDLNDLKFNYNEFDNLIKEKDEEIKKLKSKYDDKILEEKTSARKPKLQTVKKPVKKGNKNNK